MSEEMIRLQRELAQMGVTFSSQRFSGDNSYPIEFYVEHQGVGGMGPTQELAIADFVKKLLKGERKRDFGPHSPESDNYDRFDDDL